MAKQENNKKITAIVPTYNEAERIGRVLEVLITYPYFAEVIVVDDGSTDNTENVLSKYPVRYVKNAINEGKGRAMDIGVQLSKGDIIFFADADISGLTHEVIDDILVPVVDGVVDMSIGMRNRKIYYLHYIIVLVPLLGGESAVTKNLWQMLPNYYKHRFRVEAGLNFYARYYGKGFNYKIFKGLSQVIKEKKYGLREGLRQRWHLYSNLISAQLKLQFVDIPKSTRNKRFSALVALQSLVGIFLGSLFFIAAYFGPQWLIYKIFSEELIEDPAAPIANFFLRLAELVSLNILLIIGSIIIIINFIVFLLTSKRLSYLFNSLTYKIKNER